MSWINPGKGVRDSRGPVLADTTARSLLESRVPRGLRPWMRKQDKAAQDALAHLCSEPARALQAFGPVAYAEMLKDQVSAELRVAERRVPIAEHFRKHDVIGDDQVSAMRAAAAAAHQLGQQRFAATMEVLRRQPSAVVDADRLSLQRIQNSTRARLLEQLRPALKAGPAVLAKVIADAGAEPSQRNELRSALDQLHLDIAANSEGISAKVEPVLAQARDALVPAPVQEAQSLLAQLAAVESGDPEVASGISG